jgi:hypothetical protein
VTGEPVEQSASEAFGAEHLGPFAKRLRLEVLRSLEVVPQVRLSSPRCARVVARMAPERPTEKKMAEAEGGRTGKPRVWRAKGASKPRAREPYPTTQQHALGHGGAISSREKTVQ